ncbi:metalloregulator ArsR/SmtB family transcription factor [Marinicellulosiphila megalodicopiae]|uniref:metalloregulator ArsR/SmtB family transcription factor n=1 Tax=Marinicellulosiphila megalodicopiae TaxID=2724896 RepID=UPI003BAF0C76
MIKTAQFFKCLSDDTRLHATLLILLEGELCVCELTQALNESQPKISRHLAQLRNCSILDDTKRGHWVYYSIAKTLPKWALDVLNTTSQSDLKSLKIFQKNLKAMKNRPTCC